MNNPFQILIPWGCRSDKSLVDPVINRLDRESDIECQVCHLPAGNFKESVIYINNILKRVKYDLIICNADRIEMCGAAAAVFLNHIPIAQMYAGIKNNIGTLDDTNRHVITLWSTIQFCESRHAAERVFLMRNAVGLPVDQIHNVGITHFDDVELQVCEMIPRSFPFTLVLYNAPATNLDPKHQQDQILGDISEIRKLTEGQTVMAIMPAPDPAHEFIRGWLEDMRENHGWVVVDSLPKEQFHYVLSWCGMYVTNSSTGVYEAPEYLDPCQIKQIGTRNAGREKGPFEKGASDKIVKVIEEWLCTQRNGEKTGKNP